MENVEKLGTMLIKKHQTFSGTPKVPGNKLGTNKIMDQP
jgi:hypothetical protein